MKYVLTILAALTCTLCVAQVRDHQITLDPGQPKSTLHIMASDTSMSSPYFGKGSWIDADLLSNPTYLDSIVTRGDSICIFFTWYVGGWFYDSICIKKDSIAGDASKWDTSLNGIFPKGIVQVNVPEDMTDPTGNLNVWGRIDSRYPYANGADSDTMTNLAIGRDALSGLSKGRRNVGIGENAIAGDEIDDNVAVGFEAFGNSAGNRNVGVGTRAGYSPGGEDENTFIGYYAGNSVVGSKNTAIGAYAGQNNTGTMNMILGWQSGVGGGGERNVFIGHRAGYSGMGDSNIAIGDSAYFGGLAGNNNIFIGRKSGYSTLGEEDKIHIDNNGGSTPLIWGDMANDTVRIHGTFGYTNPVSGITKISGRKGHHFGDLHVGEGLTISNDSLIVSGGTGGGTPISALTDAEGDNTINNAGYAQKWNWHFGEGSLAPAIEINATYDGDTACNGDSLFAFKVVADYSDESTEYDGHISAAIAGIFNEGVKDCANNVTGVYGESSYGSGVYGQSTDNIGVHGQSLNSYGVYGSSSTGSGVYGTSSSGAAIRSEGRLLTKQGTAVSSTNNLSLVNGTNGGNLYEVTGTTQINRISNSGWINGSEITLLFRSTPTVKHNQSSSGSNTKIILADGLDFTAAAGDMLTLKLATLNGSQGWYEKSRSRVATGGGGDVPISSLTDAESDNTLSLGEYRQTWVGTPVTGSHIGLQVIEDIEDYDSTVSYDTTAAFVAEVKGTTDVIEWPHTSAAGIFKYTGHINYSGDGPEGWAIRANGVGGYASGIYVKSDNGYGIYAASGGDPAVYGTMTGSNSIAIDGHTSQSSSLAMRAYNSHATAGTALAVQTEGPGSIGLNMINRTTATYNNSVVDGLTLNRTLVSGSSAAGLGNRILFNTSTSGSTTAFTNSITSRWGIGDRNSQFLISGSDGGTEKLNLGLNGNGQAQLFQYGSGDFTDEDPPTYIAGFNSNGVIIEIDPSDLGGGGGGSAIHEVGATVDGGGNVVSAGFVGYRPVSVSGTIKKVTVLADQAGDIEWDIKKSTYSDFPSTTSIVASAPPELSNSQKYQDSTLSGWTTTVTAGDVLEFRITGTPDDITWCTILLEIEE